MNAQNRIISNTFFFSLLLSSLYLGYLMFSSFLYIILFSILVVIVANPVYEWFLKKAKNSTSASLLSTFFVFLFVLIPGMVLMVFLVEQLSVLIPAATKFFRETKDYNYYLSNIPVLGPFFDKLKILLIQNEVDFPGLVAKYGNTVANFILAKGQALLSNLGSILVGMIFVLMSMFFLFRDGKAFYNTFYEIIPLSEREKNFLFSQTFISVKAIFLGTILTAAVQGVLGFIAYLFLGIPFSLIWGFATFVTSFFPIVGSALIWVPVAIYCIFAKSLVAAVGMLLYGVLVIGMADNIVRPILIGGQTNINTMIMVFAIIGGMDIFGFIGIFLAPIVIVLINNLLLIYRERFSDQVLIDAFQDNPPAPAEEIQENPGE